jgi:hypothetical protein
MAKEAVIHSEFVRIWLCGNAKALFSPKTCLLQKAEQEQGRTGIIKSDQNFD